MFRDLHLLVIGTLIIVSGVIFMGSADWESPDVRGRSVLQVIGGFALVLFGGRFFVKWRDS